MKNGWRKSPLVRGYILLGLLGGLLTVLLSFWLETLEQKTKVVSWGKGRTPDLAQALIRNDVLSVRGMGDALISMGVNSIRIDRAIEGDFSPVFVQPADSLRKTDGLDCRWGVEFQFPVEHYSLEVGRVAGCISFSDAAQSIYRSSSVFLFALAFPLLLFISAVIPLLRYRTALNRVIIELESRPGIQSGSFDQISSSILNMMNARIMRELELQDKVQKLEQASEIGRLATQVAHDIRSPLSSLKVVGDLLADVPLEIREMMGHSIARIEQIAAQLLSAHRQSALQPEPLGVIEVRPVVESIVKEKQFMIQDRPGLKIRVDQNPKLQRARIMGSGTELGRVLSNLLNNSLEALKDRGNVDVRLLSEDRSEGQELPGLIIEIKDDGPGIPPEVLARLGERGLSAGKVSGSGLGLYHAFETVKNWGGTLNVASEVGKGTSIRIQLPMNSVG
jgi:signal transduction histidine kinase